MWLWYIQLVYTSHREWHTFPLQFKQGLTFQISHGWQSNSHRVDSTNLYSQRCEICTVNPVRFVLSHTVQISQGWQYISDRVDNKSLTGLTLQVSQGWHYISQILDCRHLRRKHWSFLLWLTSTAENISSIYTVYILYIYLRIYSYSHYRSLYTLKAVVPSQLYKK